MLRKHLAQETLFWYDSRTANLNITASRLAAERGPAAGPRGVPWPRDTRHRCAESQRFLFDKTLTVNQYEVHIYPQLLAGHQELPLPQPLEGNSRLE